MRRQWICAAPYICDCLPMEHAERKKSYAEVLAPEVYPVFPEDERYPKIVCFPGEEVEPVAVPRPTVAPWSNAGLLVGERKFGPLVCNPRKKAVVSVIDPDLAAVIESVPTSVPEP